MPNYHRVAKRVARKYGIPPSLFLSLIKHESGWNPNAVSPAGAIGFGQLMPGTAQGLGVDPHNPRQNLIGSARYLSQQYKAFGNWRKALAAYNAGPGAVQSGAWLDYPETTAYVRNVLGGANGRLNVPGRSQGLSGASRGMPDPTQMALEGLAAISSGQKFNPLDQLAALAGSLTSGGGGGVQTRGAQAAPANIKKWVSLAAGADRPGVHTKRPVLALAARIGRLYGQPLTISTGTNHSQYTVNGNVSNHWNGMAADIPAAGAALHKLGFAALRAVGVSRKRARQMARTGGLFNIGRYQIIFATNEGGNHYDHLHIGIRR